MADASLTIAVLGGTGNLGPGLAMRWARAGYTVVIGSRSAERANAAAQALNARAGVATIRGADNQAAAAAADIAVLTVPYAHQRDTLAAVAARLEGKILVDVTVPLAPPKVSRVKLPPEGAAAKAAQRLLGAGVRVVSAFQNVAAHHLADPDAAVDCDVLVTGDDPGARAVVIGLAEAAGLRAWHAGPLDNAVVAEAMTSVLIFMNRRYKIDGAGLRITGTPADDAGRDQ